MKKELTVPADNPVMRVDVFISDIACIMPRNQLKSRKAVIRINGKTAKLSKNVIPGDFVNIECMDIPEQKIIPEKTDLDIIYEDDTVLVVNKKRGVVVHPANGHYSGTLAQGLAWYLGRELNEQNQFRAGIVHRLDKDTSGVLITAKTLAAHEFLSDQFREKTCSKLYLAIVKGEMKNPEGVIENYLTRDRRDRKKYAVSRDGKIAKTSYRVLRRLNDCCLVALNLHTGRTHQLRVHMRHIGHPIIGDPIYGKKHPEYPLLLHAYRLTIAIPSSKPSAEKTKTFRAHLPDDFKKALTDLAASFTK